jgi:ergothioneine biosynthesis protein EgtC
MGAASSERAAPVLHSRKNRAEDNAAWPKSVEQLTHRPRAAERPCAMLKKRRTLPTNAAEDPRPMCRFVAYLGEPIFLEELIAKPSHSLVRQSLRAQQAKAATNGDGFGIGWYGERAEPAVYREILPAWSDENLQSLAATVRSGLFFAHVRAATGGGLSRHNCHPFRHGRWLFMHNGQIGGYARVRRTLEALLPDALYAQRRGATDSELLFLLVMTLIEQGEPPEAAVPAVLARVASLLHESGVDEPLRFAAALADGQRIHAFRIASDDRPPTLYALHDERGSIIASEPLGDEVAGWQALPAGAVITLERGRAPRQAARATAESAYS